MSIWRRRPRGDEGFTLMDAIAGMTVMGIFMVIFTGSIVMMFRSSNQSQAVTHTSQQVNNAFTWLDREIRYADYVSEPGQVTITGQDTPDWYVEFESTDPSTLTSVCHQLRVDGGQLQQRSWAASGAASAWQPLATGLTNGAAAPGSSSVPFERVLASKSGSAPPAVPSTQLVVNLTVSEGLGANAAVSQSSVTLVAFNTDSTTAASGICTGMRP